MPTFSPWLDTNFLANIRSKDDGIWRRIFIIPFDTKFTEETKDINMPSKLKAELPQILGWAIKGFKTYMEVYKEKVPRPKSVDIALSDYKKKMDILNDFIDCRCNIVPGYLTKEETLYKEFKQWCLDSQEPIIKESSFKRDLPLHGFSLKKDIKQGWVVEGLKLISDTRQITFRQVREEDYEL